MSPLRGWDSRASITSGFRHWLKYAAAPRLAKICASQNRQSNVMMTQTDDLQQQPFTPIPDDRPLTDRKRDLVRWMLQHGDPEAAAYLEQLDRARVISRCPCGCASIDFAIEGIPRREGGMRILADFEFGDEKHPCGIFVFENNGTLAGLEVYGGTVAALAVLPDVTEIRPMAFEWNS
jgi:hypothetical protein